MRNEILELSFEFALDIIEFAELLEEKRKFVEQHNNIEVKSNG